MTRWLLALALMALPVAALADGVVRPPREYSGSLEERGQEAIIIFDQSREPGGSREDLILKIKVEGDVSRFAWVVPFPSAPTIAKEDAELFTELFRFVQARSRRWRGSEDKSEGAKEAASKAPDVHVISRKVVGSYDTAVVRANEKGALNRWLEAEGFQPLAGAEDVIDFYRDKGYVFAAIKVSDAAFTDGAAMDLHPLRFSFRTGGRDGIYFPMRLTGLQKERFDVNLYVFYGKWLNDDISRFGFVFRGFELRHRDWDTPECKPNAGKAWSAPQTDPYLRSSAHRLPTVTRLFQKLHPGGRYYLTNLQAFDLEPEDVRHWVDDLWLFPYYTSKGFVPYDARKGGVASRAYPNAGSPGAAASSEDGEEADGDDASEEEGSGWGWWWLFILLVAGGVGAVVLLRSR